SLVLINNSEISAASIARLTPYLFLTLAVASVVLPSLRTYRSVWRFTALNDALRITGATGGIVVSAEALRIWFDRDYARWLALPILQALMILFFLVGSRVLVRLASRAHSVQGKAVATAPVDEIDLVVALG